MKPGPKCLHLPHPWRRTCQFLFQEDFLRPGGISKHHMAGGWKVFTNLPGTAFGFPESRIVFRLPAAHGEPTASSTGWGKRAHRWAAGPQAKLWLRQTRLHLNILRFYIKLPVWSMISFWFSFFGVVLSREAIRKAWPKGQWPLFLRLIAEQSNLCRFQKETKQQTHWHT